MSSYSCKYLLFPFPDLFFFLGFFIASVLFYIELKKNLNLPLMYLVLFALTV